MDSCAEMRDDGGFADQALVYTPSLSLGSGILLRSTASIPGGVGSGILLRSPSSIPGVVPRPPGTAQVQGIAGSNPCHEGGGNFELTMFSPG